MQEWIIAMLVLSILLILRDMAKTVLKGRKSRKEEPFPLGGEHPQKEKVERYAASFQKLADTFYGMPYKKEYLSSAQVENVIRETGERLQKLLPERTVLGRPRRGDVSVRGGNGTCDRAGG